MKTSPHTLPVRIAAAGVYLTADLTLVSRRAGLVIFVHGTGSSRASPRNRHVARKLAAAGFSTLLPDLLTREENTLDALTGELRFDIAALAQRTVAIVDWANGEEATAELPVGLFGAATGAAAAIVAAAERPDNVRAVVSRGGRVDLAGEALRRLEAPLLMLVGSKDEGIVDFHRRVLPQLTCEHQYTTIAGASHLFEEPGKLDEVADAAVDWFAAHLAR